MKFQMVITTKDFGQIKSTIVDDSDAEYDKVVNLAKSAGRGDLQYLEMTVGTSYKIIPESILLTSIIEVVMLD